MDVRDVVATDPHRSPAEADRVLQADAWQSEVTLQTRDERLVPVEAQTCAINGPDGPLSVAFLRDLSARKLADHALQAASG